MTRTILYILGAYPVWSETFLRQDLTYLLRTDLPVRPVALYPGDTQCEESWPHVPCLTPAGTRGLAAPGGGRATVLRWLPRILTTRMSLLQHRRLKRSLVRLIREENVGHIHAEFADLPGLLAAAASRETGVSYSIGVHARDVYIAKFQPSFLFKQARFLTCCNTAALCAVLSQCPDTMRRAHLIFHGLDLRQWSFRPRSAALHPPLKLLFVGRFVEKKGIDTLLLALKGLLADGGEASLTLIGDGPLLVPLKSQVEELGIADRITWTGIVSREDVARALQQVDCLVVPSRVSRDGDRDGIPNVVLEAMATGAAVIGTAAGGLGDALTVRTGWVFRAGDDAALTQILRDLPLDQQAVDARRRAARKLIEERFDADRLAEDRASLLQEALAASAS